MKKWRLPRLSRGWRTVRNLLLTLAVLIFLWGESGCPIPNARLNFRRMELANMAGPSDIRGVFLDGGWDRAWQTVGVREDQVVLLESWNWTESGSIMSFWPRRPEGATLVPMPGYGSEFEEERDIIAVDVPEGTASARLELRVSCWYQGELWQYVPISLRLEDFDPGKGAPKRWDKTYTVEGELLKDGGVLFRVVSGDEGMDPANNIAGLERIALDQIARWETYQREERYRPINCRMEAVFYDNNGGELGRTALSTPEGGGTDGP